MDMKLVILLEVQEPSKEIAKDIMRILSDRDLAQRIAVESTEIFNGKEANFNEIVTMIEKHKRGIDEDKVPAVTDDIMEQLDNIAKEHFSYGTN